MADLRLVIHLAFDRWQKDESCHLVLDYEDFVSLTKSGPQTYSELLRPEDMIKPYVDVDLEIARHRHGLRHGAAW